MVRLRRVKHETDQSCSPTAPTIINKKSHCSLPCSLIFWTHTWYIKTMCQVRLTISIYTQVVHIGDTKVYKIKYTYMINIDTEAANDTDLIMP